jgi:ribonuclease BN (tRNA processing enzyme)
VKVTLLRSALTGGPDGDVQFLTSFLLDQSVVIDAGSVGFALSLEEQARVQHILISHTHSDHIASLPIFLENVYRAADHVVTVHGSQPVLDCLQNDVFNDRVWPDFVRITRQGNPFLKLVPLPSGTPVELAGLRITAVPVDHVVPTVGFIVEDGRSAIAISSDTGPTEEIWRRANQTENLKGVFLEVTFPSAMSALGELTKHHTPHSFAQEARKLPPGMPLFAYHIKPRYAPQVAGELRNLALPITIVESGQVYSF